MSILVKNGTLDRTLNSAGNKLVAIDFSNDNCPPCRMIHPYWESLVTKYKNVIFCTVKCSECPIESQKYGIQATPTFIFIRNNKILERFAGADRDKINQCLEKHKELFQGQGRTLGAAVNQNDYLASLQRKLNHQDSEPQTQPPPPPQPPAQSPQSPPPPPPQQAVPQLLHDQLSEMGFSEEQITSAYQATKSEDIGIIINYMEDQQNQTKPESSNPASSSENASSAPQEVPEQSAKQEQVANDLTKPLDEEGEKVRQTLISMGYDGELAQMAINSVGYQDVNRCIEIIQKIERGEPIPMPKHKKTQAELDATLARYKEIIAKKKEQEAQKVSPKAQAANELARRKQVMENLEMKRKIDEQQRLLAIQEQQKAKIQDKIDREKVRKRIQAQREEQKRQQEAAKSGVQAPPPQKPQVQHQQGPKKPVTDCTLRLQFPDGSAKVQKFKPEETLGDVERWVKANNPAAAGRNIAFESAFPKMDFTRSSFGKSLLEAQLCPRSQLIIKFV